VAQKVVILSTEPSIIGRTVELQKGYVLEKENIGMQMPKWKFLLFRSAEWAQSPVHDSVTIFLTSICAASRNQKERRSGYTHSHSDQRPKKMMEV
jgi:hypothetical protein